MDDTDRYAGLEYRRMISWSSRLEREWPLYAQAFGSVDPRTLLDLGCGPGEHCARFAIEGWSTVGIDGSAAQIADARRHHPGLRFVQADLAALPPEVDGPFGAVLCVGNVLPNLDDATLDRLLARVSRLLAVGGRVVLQQLEFGPILAGRRRSIGPIFRPAEGEEPESAFLRIFCPTGDPRHIDFLPTRFFLRPGEETPVSVERTQTVRWRARSRSELESGLGKHGLAVLEAFGSPERTPHDPEDGQDLWLVAERRAP